MPICKQCKKRTHLLLNCKCNKNFCIKHIMSELHSCDFNYHEEGKKELTKNLIKCTRIKVDKI